MTKKNQLSIVTAALSFLTFVFLFVPGFYERSIWTYQYNTTSTGFSWYGYTSRAAWDTDVSFVNTYAHSPSAKGIYLVVTTLIIMLVVACIVLNILRYVLNKEWKIVSFIPALTAVLLGVYTFILNGCNKVKLNGWHYFDYEVKAIFFVVIILAVAAATVSLISYFKDKKV